MMRWLDFWHPSNGRLREWLESGDPAGVGEHVEQCERCADRLVELDRDLYADEPDAPSSLRHALTVLLAPPDDLPQRVIDGLESRARRGDDLWLLGEMFSIGIETAQLMFDSDQPHTDGHVHEEPTARPRSVDDPKDDAS